MPAALPKLRRVIIYVRTLFLSSFPGRDQLKPLSPGKPLSPAYRLGHRRLGEAEQACYRYCSHAQLPHCPVAHQISSLNPLRLLAGEQNEIFIYTQHLTHSSNNGLKIVSSCVERMIPFQPLILDRKDRLDKITVAQDAFIPP